MRLSDYTDYSLRVLMHCAAHAGQRITISDLAAHHGLSKNHLMKVVNDLARQGLLETTRGRGGGLRLLKPPGEIRVGDVVRAAETDFRLVACFDTGNQSCRLTPACRLRQLLGQALQAWFSTLDGATLADLAGSDLAAPSPQPLPGAPAPVALPLRRQPAGRTNTNTRTGARTAPRNSTGTGTGTGTGT